MQSEKFGDSTWRVSDLPRYFQQDLLALFEEALEPRITAALAKNDKDNVQRLLCLALDWKADSPLGCRYKVQFAKIAKVLGMTLRPLGGGRCHKSPNQHSVSLINNAFVRCDGNHRFRWWHPSDVVVLGLQVYAKSQASFQISIGLN